MDYPANSRKSKSVQPARPPEAKNIERITSSTVERRKRPLSKRFADTFVNGNAKAVWEYIAFDILVPAAKDMVSDAVSSGIDQMLFGGEQRWGNSRRRRGSGISSTGPLGSMQYGGSRGPINYNNPGRSAGPQMSRRGRAMHDFDEIVLETRADAETVIDRMYDLLSTYNVVSVSELYELVGITANFTDNKYGWTDLSGTGVVKVRGGYLLNLPRPEVLD